MRYRDASLVFVRADALLPVGDGASCSGSGGGGAVGQRGQRVGRGHPSAAAVDAAFLLEKADATKWLVARSWQAPPRSRRRPLGGLATRFASMTTQVRHAISCAAGGSGAVAGSSGRSDCIRRTFDAIGQGKKAISVDDLERFARDNGLPATYAGKFVDALLRVPEGAATASVGREQGEQVSFEEFRSFVKSREFALRKAFDLFDTDGDGRISVDDLEVSLRHVSVTCSKSRCVYRCCPQGAQNLCSTAGGGGGGAACGAAARGARQAFASAAARDGGGDGRINFPQFRSLFLLLPQNEFMVDYWMSTGASCDLDTKVAPHDLHDANQSPWGHLVAGALAGAASRTVTAPLETLRLAVMTGALEAGDLLQGAGLLMARGGGWRALFRGNAVNVMRCAPSKALDFFAFDAFKQLLPRGTAASLLAGGLAGATSWSLLYPLEVVRSRITTGTAPPGAGSGVVSVMRAICAAEGPRALYRGLGWSVAAIIPEAAIVYGLHDMLKSAYARVRGVEPDTLTKLSFGVFSAFTGQLVAYPLETVSRRLQVQSGVRVADVLSELLATGGPGAFYRGVGAATVRLLPMAVVSFGVYEVVRSAIIELEQVQVDVECGRSPLHGAPRACGGASGGAAGVAVCSLLPGPQPPGAGAACWGSEPAAGPGAPRLSCSPAVSEARLCPQVPPGRSA